jgi:hypothetical protein
MIVRQTLRSVRVDPANTGVSMRRSVCGRALFQSFAPLGGGVVERADVAEQAGG